MLTPFQDRAMRVLAANPFFEGLDPACMRWVSRSSVRKGERLFEKGAPSDRLHGLVGGRLRLFSSDAEGRELTLGLVAPGELVGEIGIFAGAPRHLSAVALENSELATLEQRDLEPLTERYPELQVALSRASAAAARRLSERLEDAAFLSIEQRVEKTLLDLAARFGERIERGTLVRFRQQDVADLLGLSRESVSKVLTSAPMRRKLELGRGSILLVGV